MVVVFGSRGYRKSASASQIARLRALEVLLESMSVGMADGRTGPWTYILLVILIRYRDVRPSKIFLPPHCRLNI